MAIVGTEGLSDQQILEEVRRGAKFVLFPYCFSVIVLTFRRSSPVRFVRPGEGSFGHAFPYILISLFFGWWGFPFGLIFTPIAIIQCLSGGTDVTGRILVRR